MRLTRKGKVTNYRCDYPKHTTTECIKKLGQLEDIEEELGIDLFTLFKALKDGIYDKQKNHYYPYTNGKLLIWEEHNEIYAYWNINDYGKTWALTKEELE